MTAPARRHRAGDLDSIVVRRLGLAEYTSVWRAMQAFNARRGARTRDEIWLLQHPPVYTLGINRKSAVVRGDNDVPLIASDRGGRITYHGPGQIVAYVLMDLKRKGMGVKQLINALEQAVIDLLSAHGVTGVRRAGAPGVYVNDAKVAALGLRVKHGGSYHGIAVNVDMDLTPFTHIDPCGYAGQETTQLTDLGVSLDVTETGERMVGCLMQTLEYGDGIHEPDPPVGLANA